MPRPTRRADVLAALPGTAPEICASTGLAKSVVWRWLGLLREDCECHVGGWVRVPGGGPFQARYVAGPGVDAICRLRPFTEAQKSARFRRKARSNGSWLDRLAQVRGRYWANRPKRRDPMIEALFGAPRREV